MSETNKLGLGPVIGRRVREIREDRGLRQEEMAQRLQAFGVPWNRSMTAKVERGERGVTLEEAVLLALALDVSLEELVPAAGKVALTSMAPAVPLATVRAVLAGADRRKLKIGDIPLFTRAVQESIEQSVELLGVYGRIWPEATMEDAVRAEEAASGEAEMKAAKRLEVDPVLVSVAAFKTWGRSLTAERDARAGVGQDISRASLRAHRGQVTRQLVAELAEVVKEAKV